MIHSRLKNGYHRIPTYMHQSKMKRTEIDKKKICIVCSCRQSLQRLLVVSLVWPHLQHGKKSTLYLELQDLSRLAQLRAVQSLDQRCPNSKNIIVLHWFHQPFPCWFLTRSSLKNLMIELFSQESTFVQISFFSVKMPVDGVSFFPDGVFYPESYLQPVLQPVLYSVIMCLLVICM